MSNLNEILTLSAKMSTFGTGFPNDKEFFHPKIYTAKGNLSKRWYVYYIFRNPETGKLERIKNIYGKSNLYKTKEKRLSVLTAYR
tara:strand:+ start:97 stop:351 length:255 start_codon:yes stop_codon:yes gene_type:complete